jgi:acetolactate synthase-1/3 small subunit
MVKMLKSQIEKRIDVLQARYFEDEDIFLRETSLLKISTPAMLENPDVCNIVRQHGASIVEVNPTYAIVTKDGMTEEILSLFNSLMQWDCVLQYVRSGAIAITKNKRELLDEYLAERKERYEA